MPLSNEGLADSVQRMVSINEQWFYFHTFEIDIDVIDRDGHLIIGNEIFIACCCVWFEILAR